MVSERYCLKGTGELLKRQPVESAPAKKKWRAWPFAVVGGVLLAFQVIAIVSSSTFGGCPWQQPYFMGGRAFWAGLLSLLAFVWPGLLGVLLVILSLPKKRMLVSAGVAAACVLVVAFMAYSGTVQAKAEQEALAAAFEGAAYVASAKEDAVHRPDCKYAGWISSENLVPYGSLEEAFASGKHPCNFCFPGNLTFAEYTIMQEYGY